MKLQPKMLIKILVRTKKCLTLVIVQLSQNDDSNKLVVGEMKGETGSVALNNLLDGNQRCIHC